jgi:O-antigen/teichoic acid export membrane protein
MASNRRNFLANLVSTLWLPALMLAAMPVYEHLLGRAGIGVIGLYILLQSLVAPLDAGLGMTMNRQMALLGAGPEGPLAMRDTVRSLEIVYWAIALAIGAVLLAASQPIGHHWIRSEQISAHALTWSVVMIALTLGLQFPFTLYHNGLLGLGRHVTSGILNIVFYTLRFAGVIPWLMLTNADPVWFFLWQAPTALLHTTALRWSLLGALPATPRPGRFSRELLSRVRNFAAGMGLIGLLSLAMAHVDKVVLSGLLQLDHFGDYTFAVMVSSGLYRIFTPVFMTVLPRMTALVRAEESDALVRLYHKASQLVAVMVMPAGAVIACFAHKILLLWTGEPVIAENADMPMRFLAAGTCLAGLMLQPFALQSAFGWTRLTLTARGIAFVLLVPLTVLAATWRGMDAAAAVWALPHLIGLTVTVPLMHRRILRGQMGRWYLRDVIAPASGAWVIAGLSRWLAPSGLAGWSLVAWLVVTGGFCQVAAVLSAGYVRGSLVSTLGRLKVRAG